MVGKARTASDVGKREGENQPESVQEYILDGLSRAARADLTKEGCTWTENRAIHDKPDRITQSVKAKREGGELCEGGGYDDRMTGWKNCLAYNHLPCVTSITIPSYLPTYLDP